VNSFLCEKWFMALFAEKHGHIINNKRVAVAVYGIAGLARFEISLAVRASHNNNNFL
jgi:hypothetical protein